MCVKYVYVIKIKYTVSIMACWLNPAIQISEEHLKIEIVLKVRIPVFFSEKLGGLETLGPHFNLVTFGWSLMGASSF